MMEPAAAFSKMSFSSLDHANLPNAADASHDMLLTISLESQKPNKISGFN